MENNRLINMPSKPIKGIFKSVAAIIPTGSAILLIQRKHEPFKDFWALSGGKLDGDETPEQGIIREVKEETGLDIQPTLVIGKYVEYGDYKGNTYEYHVTCFLASKVGGNIVPQKSEVKDIKFFNVHGIPKLAFKHNEMVAKYLELFPKD